MNYFIIPGNPPAIHFYELWGKEIVAKVPAAKFRVSHYPKLGKNPNSVKAMNEVYESHLKQLLDFYHETKSPITILGHSLGGNFGLRLLNEDTNDIVKKAVLIHPFLKKPERLGRIILKTASLFYHNNKLQTALIKNRKFFEYISSDLAHVTNAELEQAFHLAKHESLTIGTDHGPIHIHPEKRDKVAVFHNSQDMWCPAEVIAELREKVKVIECSEPHTFVTAERHRQSLFIKIVRN